MIQRHPSGTEGQGEKEPHSKGEKANPSKIAQPNLILLLFLPGKKLSSVSWITRDLLFFFSLDKTHFVSFKSLAMGLWGFWGDVSIGKHLLEEENTHGSNFHLSPWILYDQAFEKVQLKTCWWSFIIFLPCS